MRRPLAGCTPWLARIARIALIASVGLLTAGSLAAYTVHLKDGTSIVTKKKYTVQGEKAILVLPSGTETTMALAEIDFARTEAANRSDLGNAIVIENGKATDLTRSAPPPPAKQTLKDLLEQRAAAQGSTNAGAVALDSASERGASQRPATSHAGQTPLRDVALSTEIRTFIFGRGITSLEVQQGSASRRPRLVFQTSTETQVFRALQASSGALIAVREQHPGTIESFEVICDGPAGGRGGHFTLTLAQAEDLVSGRVDLPTFFIDNVEF